MIVLTNEINTMFYFPRTIKFNITMHLNLIRESNLLHLKYCIKVIIIIIYISIYIYIKSKPLLTSQFSTSALFKKKIVFIFFH